MGYENGRTHGSAASRREYEQRKRARMQQIASDPQARLAYEEHRRRRMEQIMSDPQARREYERRRAQRAHERHMRRVRMIAALVLSAAAGVAAAFCVHAAVLKKQPSEPAPAPAAAVCVQDGETVL